MAGAGGVPVLVEHDVALPVQGLYAPVGPHQIGQTNRVGAAGRQAGREVMMWTLSRIQAFGVVADFLRKVVRPLDDQVGQLTSGVFRIQDHPHTSQPAGPIGEPADHRPGCGRFVVSEDLHLPEHTPGVVVAIKTQPR